MLDLCRQESFEKDKLHSATDKRKPASSGNRTRAARVAGEHSTTEPTMLLVYVGPETLYDIHIEVRVNVNGRICDFL